MDITQTYTNMAKAIKWQIPFASLSGTLYRIDIYAEGYSGDPIQLTAGESPFVTEEDSSEDFFAPIRTQTGSIQVCTRKPDGNMLTLDEILPANNIDHPVILMVREERGQGQYRWNYAWLGFLSCEAYSQNYTEIPENLTLSVISLLEAMDSVEADTDLINGLNKARIHLYYALTELDRKVGISFFDTIYYSKESAAFLSEYTNEESKTYVVSGMSCKKILERICTYMGWCCREDGKKVYLSRVGEEGNVYSQGLDRFGGTDEQFATRSEVSLTTADMDDLSWMGTNHKRDIRQGAKSVEVVAKLEKYDLSLGLPDFPTNNMVHGVGGSLAPTMSESYAQMNINFNNMLRFWYYYMVVRQTGNYTYDVFPQGSSDVETAYEHCALNPDCDVATYYTIIQFI